MHQAKLLMLFLLTFTAGMFLMGFMSVRVSIQRPATWDMNTHSSVPQKIVGCDGKKSLETLTRETKPSASVSLGQLASWKTLGGSMDDKKKSQEILTWEAEPSAKGSVGHSVSREILSGSMDDEKKSQEILTWEAEPSANVSFEHSHLFQTFVAKQTGRTTTVAEYLKAVKSYLLHFRSPMIKEKPTQYSWPETPQEKRQRERQGKTSNRTVKRVVWHNLRMGAPRLSSSKMFGHCPVSDCAVSYDYTVYSKADAIVLDRFPKPDRPPARDHKDQVFVLHQTEAPHDFRQTPWNSAINWTWTYRVDADLFAPVGSLKRSRDVPSHSDLLQQMQRKTNMAAWFVSNCKTRSKREQFVGKMQQVLSVDIYGDCGSLVCERWNSSCNTLLNDYYFYLSFENSYCQDYITEKFYKTFRAGVYVLPVVRGSGNYSRYFPEGTFIDADKFASPLDLGRYLKALRKQKAHYVDMMWRRAHFLFHEHGIKDSYCQMCYKLHHLDRFKNTYGDMVRWNRDKCTVPSSF